MYYNWQIKFHSPPPSLYHINYCNYVLSLSPPKEKWVRWTVLHSPFEDTIKCILNVWHFIFAEWKWSQRNAMRVKVVRELLWCFFIFIKVRGLKISLSYPNSRSDLISRQSDSRMIDSNWNAFFFSLFSPQRGTYGVDLSLYAGAVTTTASALPRCLCFRSEAVHSQGYQRSSTVRY